MSRPVRRKLKFDEDSVNKLLQEVYDDSHNIRAKITRLMTKWELKIKDNGEIMALGDTIVKLIAAEAKNQDQKIMLLKYLKEVVFEKKTIGTMDKEDNGNVTDDRRNELIALVRDEMERKS